MIDTLSIFDHFVKLGKHKKNEKKLGELTKQIIFPKISYSTQIFIHNFMLIFFKYLRFCLD